MIMLEEYRYKRLRNVYLISLNLKLIITIRILINTLSKKSSNDDKSIKRKKIDNEPIKEPKRSLFSDA
jgi:hypothetical protein